MVIEATHKRQDATLYWHLDGQYLGFTQGEHSFAISLTNGDHELSLVDDLGNQLIRRFKTSGKLIATED